MKSSNLPARRIPLFVVLAACLGIAACGSSKPVDHLAPVRRALTSRGVPLATTLLSQSATKRLERLRAAATELAPAFVLPIIQDRVTQLSTGISSKRTAAAADIGEGTWFALSSDGSVFTSVGPDAVTAFTRPFQNIEAVRTALTVATSGSETIVWPATTATHAIVDVVPANVDGATAGALVIITPLSAETVRVRDAVRRGGATLSRAGVCLRVRSIVECADVPERASRIARGNAFAGSTATTSDLAEGSLQGVLASGIASEGMPRAILWTASRSSH